MNYYKVLNENGTPCNGGCGKWHLPRNKQPGKWMPPIEVIKPCVAGYHVCRRGQLVRWLGPTIWLVEIRGERICQNDKIVTSQARLLRRVTTWTEKTARLFAADCAERMLLLYETQYPGDTRPREAIAVARAFARGEINSAARAAAWAAAWDAARAAAGDAAWDAVWDAARVWQTRRLFKYLDDRRLAGKE